MSDYKNQDSGTPVEFLRGYIEKIGIIIADVVLKEAYDDKPEFAKLGGG